MIRAKMKTVWMMLMVVGACVCIGQGAVHVGIAGRTYTDPAFSPQTVALDASSCDNTSMCVYGPLPKGKSYKANDIVLSQGSLGPLYKMMVGFVNVVQPLKPSEMYDTINKLTTDMSGAMGDMTGRVTDFIGLAICIVVGFVYVLIMPIVGCCFCLCRLCRNCGGDLKSKPGKNDNKTWCMVHMIIVALLTLMTATGALLVYNTSTELSKAVENIASNVNDNLDDMETFINNTVDEVLHIGDVHFNVTRDVIFRDLDNVDSIIGVPIRDTILRDAQVEPAVQSIVQFHQVILNIGANMLGIFQSIKDINQTSADLSSNLSTVSALITQAQGEPGCTAGCTSLNISGLSLKYDPNKMPDISSHIDKVNSVLSKNLTDLALKGYDIVLDIPSELANYSKSHIDGLKSNVDKFTSSINDVTDEVRKLPNSVLGELDSIGKTIDDTADFLASYNKFRVYAAGGLGGFIMLIPVLSLLGMIFGCLGFSGSAEPHERSCLSNSGGQLLMAAVGFVFIFGWLLMLLTTILFLIGAPMERYICQPLTEDYSFMKAILDGPGGMLMTDDPNGYFLGQALLNNKSIALTFSGVLEDCKNNKGATSALKLDKGFNFDEFTDYKKHMDIEAELDNLNVDVAKMKVLSPETEKELLDFKAAIQVDFQNFKNELMENTTMTDLEDFKTVVDTAQAMSTSTANETLKEASDIINVITTTSFKTVNTQQAALLNDVTKLETDTQTLSATVDSLLQTAKTVDNYIQNHLNNMTKNETRRFAERELAVVDKFVDNTLNALNNEIAKCKPVYNLWYSIIDVSLCGQFMDPLNGFWFAMGWCVFFMTLMVCFNVKLAKYLRKMTPPGGMGPPIIAVHGGKVSPI